MVTPLCWIPVTAEDRALFVEPALETWEGGMPDLIRLLRAGWVREGKTRRMPVEDYPTYARIKHYASSYGAGTWQTHIDRWARQLPVVSDPQGGLF